MRRDYMGEEVDYRRARTALDVRFVEDYAVCLAAGSVEKYPLEEGWLQAVNGSLPHVAL